MPIPIGIPIAAAAADTLGGLFENQSADRRAQQDRAMQWRQFLAQFQNQLGQQNDERAQFGTRIAGAQALNPLTDRAFSMIQARLGMGPATLGQTGARNRALQSTAANYQPGQNPSMNRYGNELGTLRDRFMREERPQDYGMRPPRPVR